MRIGAKHGTVNYNDDMLTVSVTGPYAEGNTLQKRYECRLCQQFSSNQGLKGHENNIPPLTKDICSVFFRFRVYTNNLVLKTD